MPSLDWMRTTSLVMSRGEYLSIQGAMSGKGVAIESKGEELTLGRDVVAGYDGEMGGTPAGLYSQLAVPSEGSL